MNINIGPLAFDLNQSATILNKGFAEAGETLVDPRPFLVPDPEYPSYQAWYRLVDGTQFVHVTPDGDMIYSEEILPWLPE